MSRVKLFSIGTGVVLLAGALLHTSAAGVSAQVTGPDPIAAVEFSITIDGTEIATFSEVDGITTEVDVVEYLSGEGRGHSTKQLAAKPKPPVIVLRRALTASTAIAQWHEEVRTTGHGRKDALLVVRDQEGRTLTRFALARAFPAKVVVDQARADRLLFETVTIVCEELDRLA